MLSLSLLQTQLIFPGAASQGVPSSVVQPAPGTELVRLTTAEGESIVALFGAARTPDGQTVPDVSRRPTLIYFYGNGMCLGDAQPEFERFRRLGVNVLIPEYVGYGMSSGQPSEAGCYATADAAYDYLSSRKDVDPHGFVAGGWSLVAAVAIDLASRRPVAGLVCFSAFTSMGDMARRQFPFLPVSLLLKHRFENREKIARLSCPILIGHGRLDSLVPFVMADRLAGAVAGPVTRVEVDQGDHNDFFAVGFPCLEPVLRRFFWGLCPVETTPPESRMSCDG